MLPELTQITLSFYTEQDLREDWANFVPKWANIVPKVRTSFQKGGKRTLFQKQTNFVPKERILFQNKRTLFQNCEYCSKKLELSYKTANNVTKTRNFAKVRILFQKCQDCSNIHVNEHLNFECARERVV